MTHLVRSCTLAVAVTGVALALGGWGIDKIYIYFFRRQAEQLAQRLEAMPDHEQALGAILSVQALTSTSSCL